MCNELQFFHGTFLLERTTNRQTTVIQAWITGRNFLENDCRESVYSRKIADNICCHWQNLSFRMKMRFWKTWRAWKLPNTKRLIWWDRWWYLCDFNISHNEMCQHLEDLHNSVNQYPLNDQCVMQKIMHKEKCIQSVGHTNRF